MYDDIMESRNRALIAQKWNEGDRVHRVGHPFVWVDAEIGPSAYQPNELSALMKRYTMFYEEYPTPDAVRSDDFDQVLGEVRETLSRIFRLHFPWLAQEDYANYIKILATRRTEDYGFIKKSTNLPQTGVKHLDIGPGLGSHATYSRSALGSVYCGVEAMPESYQAQRSFFRYLAVDDVPYVDFVAAETFGVPQSRLAEIMRSAKEGIFQVPSWGFPNIDDRFFDLVTASWVLNEVNAPGILWLIGHSVRTLRPGGYLYIRDSGKLKPVRHNIDYDALLISLGFTQVSRLQVENRVNYHGVPRIYQKTSDSESPSFDELVGREIGQWGKTNENV